MKHLVTGLATFQIVETIGTALLPRRLIKAHLDHLGVPEILQPALPVVKVTTSAGLLAGLEMPRLGAVTSAALVAYYGAAVGFHLGARDHPAWSAPAAVLAVAAGIALVGLYLPAIAREVGPADRAPAAGPRVDGEG